MNGDDKCVQQITERIHEKIATIENQFHEACQKITKIVQEPVPEGADAQIEWLQIHIVAYNAQVTKKLKSSVQTYELTDKPDYDGILSLLKYLEQQKDNELLDIDLLVALTSMNYQSTRGMSIKDKKETKKMQDMLLEDISNEDNDGFGDDNDQDKSENPLINQPD